MSEKIYQFVNEKYRSSIPDLSDYRVYLKLRWTLAALRQGRWLSAIATGFPAYISPTAWRLLVEELLARKRDKHPNKIRKHVLLDR
ncbi:MAG: hypothetical protein HC925_08640 [Coleofasciculaceae cyanobacterium SM2_3_26]|nr:hypothetical protein [Coleofasciculaceae cyanobacterium SM2_3_26]